MGLSQQLLQLPVLGLELFQLLGLGDLQPPVLGAPAVERLLGDPVLPAQIGRLRARLRLLQDPDDLLFGESLPLHGECSLSVLPENSLSKWTVLWGEVTYTNRPACSQASCEN